MKIIVIGAGPAGLTATYELLTKGKDVEVIVLEESNCLGGISKTVNYKGSRMDMGGHRFFSKDERVNEWWENILPMQGARSKDDIMLERTISLADNGPDPEKSDIVMLLRRRVSRIFFDSKFYDYPISLKPQLSLIWAYLILLRSDLVILALYFTNFPKIIWKTFILTGLGESFIPCFLSTIQKTFGADIQEN